MLVIWAFFEKVCLINSFEFVTGNKFFYDNRFRFGAHHCIYAPVMWYIIDTGKQMTFFLEARPFGQMLTDQLSIGRLATNFREILIKNQII